MDYIIYGNYEIDLELVADKIAEFTSSTNIEVGVQGLQDIFEQIIEEQGLAPTKMVTEHQF